MKRMKVKLPPRSPPTNQQPPTQVERPSEACQSSLGEREGEGSPTMTAITFFIVFWLKKE